MHSAITLLDRGLKIDAIFAVHESSSYGMLRALRNKNLAGKYPFVGFDPTKFLLQALKNGEVDALVIQDAARMGYLSIKAAVAAARGTALKESNIFIDAILLTRENMNNPDIQRLLPRNI